MSNLFVEITHLEHTSVEICGQTEALLSAFKSVEVVMQDTKPNQRFEYLENTVLSLLQLIKGLREFKGQIGPKDEPPRPANPGQ